MKINNLPEFRYNHPNFPEPNPGTRVSLQDIPSDESSLNLEVKAPDGRVGFAQINFQDNGNVVIRVHLDGGGQNPIHVLVVGDSGILFEG